MFERKISQKFEQKEYLEIFKNAIGLRDALREFNQLKLEDERPIFSLECNEQNIKSWLEQYFPVDLNLRQFLKKGKDKRRKRSDSSN